MKRLILEMGMGNDLYGEDYTKAACRAVRDALHHSSLSLFKSMNLDPSKMFVRVTIGVQKPEKVNSLKVIKELPHGHIQVLVEEGGLNIMATGNNMWHVIATAGIEVFIDVEDVKISLMPCS